MGAERQINARKIMNTSFALAARFESSVVGNQQNQHGQSLVFISDCPNKYL